MALCKRAMECKTCKAVIEWRSITACRIVVNAGTAIECRGIMKRRFCIAIAITLLILAAGCAAGFQKSEQEKEK